MAQELMSKVEADDARRLGYPVEEVLPGGWRICWERLKVPPSSPRRAHAALQRKLRR